MNVDVGVFFDSVRGATRPNSFVVVIDRYREGTLGGLLANNVFLQETIDFFGLRQIEVHDRFTLGLHLAFVNDFIAQFHALIANVDARTSNQLLYLLLTLATKGTLQ